MSISVAKETNIRKRYLKSTQFYCNRIGCCWGSSVTQKRVVPVASLAISAAAHCCDKMYCPPQRQCLAGISDLSGLHVFCAR